MNAHATTVAQDVAVAGFNVGVWFATIVSWAGINQFTSLLATAAAVGVSVASFLWIKKQSRDSSARQALQMENLRLEREVLEQKLATSGQPPPRRTDETAGFGE